MERKRQMIASAIQITAVDGEKEAAVEKIVDDAFNKLNAGE